MGEVKRYDPINSDGTCGMCIEDADYGAYVEYADYAALEAENAKLRAELERRVPDGWKPVPVEPTPEMVSAAEEAYMPFGDMDIALRMAILAAPSAPKADDPVKRMLLEALSKAVHYMEQMQDEIDGLINYAGGTGGFGEYEKHIEAVRATIASARKEGGK